MKYIFPISLLVLSLLTAAAAQPPPNANAPEFELSDQYGQAHTLRSFPGRTIVLLDGLCREIDKIE